ncbi:MAG: tRNA (adenosine(37)-N6)-threonylcarbamoyltransferase complex ATPase subunit type 1 TsaE [Planctomycetota bacterium]|jgi:tRNA threonylcarbamoyladenosine biosynthesis protein TsaE
MDFDIVTNSPQETIELGCRLAKQLKGGEVLAICGPLGSGKTQLIKGLATGLGAAEGGRVVNSPTFVIVNEYSGRFDIYHIDAYRLETAEQFEMLGFDDYCYPDSVVLIEWADKVASSLKGLGCIEVKLAHTGPQQRRINISFLPEYIRL